jgi:hypothetical protein
MLNLPYAKSLGQGDIEVALKTLKIFPPEGLKSVAFLIK